MDCAGTVTTSPVTGTLIHLRTAWRSILLQFTPTATPTSMSTMLNRTATARTAPTATAARTIEGCTSPWATTPGRRPSRGPSPGRANPTEDGPRGGAV